MLNRRHFLKQTAGFAVVGLSVPSAAHAANLPGIQAASMRGSIDATDLGARPGALDDQSRIFARMLERAGNQDMPVFLPPGTYVVSNLTLPRRLCLTGVPGATRIIYGGDGHLLAAEDAEHIELTGLVIDGANRWIGDHAQGLLDLRAVQHLVIDNCRIMGSGKNGLSLERVSGLSNVRRSPAPPMPAYIPSKRASCRSRRIRSPTAATAASWCIAGRSPTTTP